MSLKRKTNTKIQFLKGLGLMILISMSSCTESITINEDGSGKVSLDIDASQIIGMSGGEALGGAKNIDSTTFVKDILIRKKDSIAKLPVKEQERLKALINGTLRMVINNENLEGSMKFANNFKKASEIPDVMQAFRDITALQKPKDAAMMSSFQNSMASYSFDGKKFKKNVELIKKETPQPEYGMYKEMMEMFTYDVKYTFPKKIKSVSNKSAVISDDKKTLTISYPLTDYVDNPDRMALEVELEK